MPLTAGQTEAAFADIKIEPLGVGRDHAVEPGGARCRQDRLITRVLHADDQVLAQASIEQPRVLRQVMNVAPQIIRAEVRTIHTVEKDASLRGPVKPGEQFQQRRFARTNGADHRDAVAGAHQEGRNLDRLVLLLVGKMHLLQAQLKIAGFGADRATVFHFAIDGGPHNPIKTLQGRLRMLPLHQQGGDLRKRPQRPAADNRAGNQAAHGQIARRNTVDTDSDHADIRELLDHRGKVGRQPRQRFQIELVVGHFNGQGMPATAKGGLRRQRLDRFNAID